MIHKLSSEIDAVDIRLQDTAKVKFIAHYKTDIKPIIKTALCNTIDSALYT